MKEGGGILLDKTDSVQREQLSIEVEALTGYVFCLFVVVFKKGTSINWESISLRIPEHSCSSPGTVVLVS